MIPRPKNNRTYDDYDASIAIEVLARLPVLPARFSPRIMELALGENKTDRRRAQQLLETLPNIHLIQLEGWTQGNKRSALLQLNGLLA